MKSKLLVPLVLLLILPILVSATDYYVSPGGDGSNGRSWVTAWPSLGAIQWGDIGAMDTVYISGGPSGNTITYHERLEIGAGGTNDYNRVTITKGEHIDHNGTVIISNTGNRRTIYLSGKDYVTIRNISTQGRGLFFQNSVGVIIENMDILHWGNTEEDLPNNVYKSHGGIFVQGSGGANEDMIIRNNYIWTPGTLQDGQQDGIYTQWNINITIEGNRIIMDAEPEDDSPPHSDTIHINNDESFTIRNNWLELDTDCSECQTIIGGLKGTTYIYNNVMIGSRGQQWQSYLDVARDTGNVEFYNNIVISQWPGNGIAIQDFRSGSTYRNNIIICGSGGSGCKNIVGDYDSSNIIGSSASQLKLDSEYRPQSDSPVIDAGTDLGAPYNVDMDGNIRPPGEWDVGPYEYQAATPCLNDDMCTHLNAPCVDYVCDLGGTDICIATYPTVPCADNGAYCDGVEQCQDGSCVSMNPPCIDDGIPCTILCDETTDTCNVPDNSLCDDGFFCTSDVCFAGAGCQNAPITGPCDDEIDCTKSDTCTSGMCLGTPDHSSCLPLPDGCTSGTCNQVLGCSYEPTGCTVTAFLPGVDVEAEDGEIEASMGITDDGTDVYVHLTDPVEDGGWVNFTFNIQQAGDYRLEARVNSHGSSGDNSFYVGLNSEPARNDDIYAYDTIQFNGFQWDNVSLRGGGDHLVAEHDPMNWTLGTGPHTFTFYGRESECWLDKIILLPLSSQSQTYHHADNNPPDCVIDLNELLVFMQRWRVSIADVGMVEMMNAIELWKAGNSCS